MVENESKILQNTNTANASATFTAEYINSNMRLTEESDINCDTTD